MTANYVRAPPWLSLCFLFHW